MAADALDRSDAGSLGGQVATAPMRSRHLDDVVDIEELTYPRPWPRLIFEAELAKPGRRYLVARLGRRVVGYGGALDQAGDVHITTVAVHPDVQGRGIATRLVHDLLVAARELAPQEDAGVTLEVRAGNEPAQRLYRRFGFAVEGRRPGYYADNGEDALIMWLHDLHSPAVAATLSAVSSQLGTGRGRGLLSRARARTRPPT